MMRKTAFAAIIATVAVLAVPPTHAQSTNPQPTLYRLEKATIYQHGCFSPCECPIAEVGPVRGTFRLTFTGSDPLFENYAVTGVNWRIPFGSSRIPVTGSGTYRIGGEFARQHQLSLDLKVGDDPVEHFDSGVVIGGSEWPRIAIRISIHGEYCLDTVFEVHARPLMRLTVGPTALSWDPLVWATGYDVVAGDLQALRASRGNFASATRQCLADDGGAGAVAFSATPSAGSAFWFAGRENEGTSLGSYDGDDAGQIGFRDPGIDAAASGCP